MQISSRTFEHNTRLPIEYTCEAHLLDAPTGVNPPLLIENIPDNAKTLLLLVEDISSKKSPIGPWLHWLVFNMPVQSDSFYIEENSIPEGEEGKSTNGTIGFVPACPSEGEHTYVFTVHALSGGINAFRGASREEVMSQATPHIITTATLHAQYSLINKAM